MTRALALPFTVLAFVYEERGEGREMIRNLERAVQLNPDPQLVAALGQLEAQFLEPRDSE